MLLRLEAGLPVSNGVTAGFRKESDLIVEIECRK